MEERTIKINTTEEGQKLFDEAVKKMANRWMNEWAADLIDKETKKEEMKFTAKKPKVDVPYEEDKKSSPKWWSKSDIDGLASINAKEKEIEQAKGIYEQLKTSYQNMPIYGSKGSIDPIESKPTNFSKVYPSYPESSGHVVESSGYPYNSRISYSDEVVITQKKYDELIANQKPVEWSDDLVLIDINKLTSYILSDFGLFVEKNMERLRAFKANSTEIYQKHKENSLTDDEFEVWDEVYNLILKYRSYEK